MPRMMEPSRPLSSSVVDEADLDKGKVSWVSPVARAIMKSEVGDRVAIRSPAGRREVEIIFIGYPEV